MKRRHLLLLGLTLVLGSCARSGVKVPGDASAAPDVRANDAIDDAVRTSRDLASEADHDVPASDASIPVEAGAIEAGGSEVAVDGGMDGGSVPIDGALASFCDGDSPRMVVNGVAITPDLSAQPLAMDCCDGVQVAATSGELAFPIGFSWLAEVGASFQLSATLDLSSPPYGWRVMVMAGCNVTSAGCVGPMDYYREGLTGWLSVSRASGRYVTGICVHVEESLEEPGVMLHSLDLYVPQIVAP
jgi:hypothetical protein